MLFLSSVDLRMLVFHVSRIYCLIDNLLERLVQGDLEIGSPINYSQQSLRSRVACISTSVWALGDSVYVGSR
jgi:hypothetical protein